MRTLFPDTTGLVGKEAAFRLACIQAPGTPPNLAV